MRHSTLALLTLCGLPLLAQACPWPFSCCRPSALVYRPCPPPIRVHRCGLPVQFVRVAETKEPEPTPVVVKEDVAPDGWCHIRGRIVFEGDPIPKQLAIPKGNGAYTEDWIVDPENRGIKNVVVWLSPEPTEDEWKRLKVTGPGRLQTFPSFQAKDIFPTLPQQQNATILVPESPLAFFPHIAVVRTGSDIVVKNVSTRLNSITFTSRENGEGAPQIPPLGGEFRFAQVKPERFPIEFGSTAHPWMKAWVRIFDHPYFAVTDSNGRFDIRFAPNGNLRLFIWQESVGFRNGKEGRFGEAIQAPSGRLELGDIKFKPLR